jgi:mannonate dehydratase
LKRPGAEKDYRMDEIEKAKQKIRTLSEAEKEKLFNNMMLGLPGSNESFTAEQIKMALDTYKEMDVVQLKKKLAYFLKEVVPVAESYGLRLAIHPDDPPYPVLGLPRIVSTEKDLEDIIQMIKSAANGFCFCTGSLGARPDNDIVKMLQQFGDQIHFLHWRNTKRDAEGNFYEAAHREGDTDMFAVISEIVALQKRKNISILMRPDHGHQMLDDLKKKTYPGYSAIGRLKGLAELRGVEYAISKNISDSCIPEDCR